MFDQINRTEALSNWLKIAEYIDDRHCTANQCKRYHQATLRVKRSYGHHRKGILSTEPLTCNGA